jgi:hypothetical protein
LKNAPQYKQLTLVPTSKKKRISHYSLIPCSDLENNDPIYGRHFKHYSQKKAKAQATLEFLEDRRDLKTHTTIIEINGQEVEILNYRCPFINCKNILSFRKIGKGYEICHNIARIVCEKNKWEQWDPINLMPACATCNGHGKEGMGTRTFAEFILSQPFPESPIFQIFWTKHQRYNGKDGRRNLNFFVFLADAMGVWQHELFDRILEEIEIYEINSWVAPKICTVEIQKQKENNERIKTLDANISKGMTKLHQHDTNYCEAEEIRRKEFDALIAQEQLEFEERVRALTNDFQKNHNLLDKSYSLTRTLLREQLNSEKEERASLKKENKIIEDHDTRVEMDRRLQVYEPAGKLRNSVKDFYRSLNSYPK